jgi:hypothetical protein
MPDSLARLQYPIGRFDPPAEVTDAHVRAWIEDIESVPRRLRALVEHLSAAQLDTRYRPGGWTVRQVVHHLADSHLNSYIRFKWALTEDRPTIKPYFEERWAELPDYRVVPIGVSLDLLEALHIRWCALLRSLRPDDLRREFIHPDSGSVSLAVNIGIYAWHGRHHMMHIQMLADREGWS